MDDRPELPPAASPITRRDALKGAAGLAAIGAGVAGAGRHLVPAAVPPAPAAARRERVAIIGAGAGGLAAAHFLAGTHDVELFEARGRIGGHCDSRTVEHRGHRVTVDLGAQFFHPDTHPIYVTLLEELGLYDPEHPEGDETLESPGSLCVFPMGGGPPVFSSANPLATLPRALDFAAFTQFARQAVLSGLPWETSVGAWIRSLPLQQPFKDEVLAPWITATIGSSRADAMRSSARAILQTFALAFPADLARPATTFTSRIGLQGNLQRLLDRSPEVEVHLRAPVRALERKRGRWFVRTPHGRRGPFPPRRAQRAAAGRAQAAAPVARVRGGDRAARRLPLLRLAPADPRRPGVRARRPRELGGVQRGRRRPRVRGQRVARRAARASALGRDGRPLQVVGDAPRRRPGSDPAGAALPAPADRPRVAPGRAPVAPPAGAQAACTSAASTRRAWTCRSRRSTPPCRSRGRSPRAARRWPRSTRGSPPGAAPASPTTCSVGRACSGAWRCRPPP